MTTSPDPDLEGEQTDLEAEPARERSNYVPDASLMRVLLLAMGVGAVAGVAVILLIYFFGPSVRTALPF